MICESNIVRDASLKTGCGKVWNVRPRFGRSVLRSRKARNRPQRIFKTERLFLLPSRIGSVNCGQHHANAMTRTTGCSLNGNCGSEIAGWNSTRTVRETPRERPWPLQRVSASQRKSHRFHSENIRWSSRPRPVNRLQATSQPRRVMRGGSKSDALGSKGTGQTRTCGNTGKAFAFTQGTEL